MTASNDCNHDHHEDEPTRFAIRGNLVVGAIGLVAGAVTGSAPVIADSGHNFGDFLAHREHLETTESERHDRGVAETTRRRRRAGVIIGAIAAATALYSGFELREQLSSEEPEPLKTAALIVELGSVSVNEVVRRKFKKNPPELSGQRHSHAHNKVDLGCSIAAVVGIGLNPIVPGAEGAAGIGVSIVTGRLAQKVYSGSVH